MKRKQRSYPRTSPRNTCTRNTLTTIDGTALKEVNDLKYLDSWVGSTERDIDVRKALAWR